MRKGGRVEVDAACRAAAPSMEPHLIRCGRAEGTFSGSATVASLQWSRISLDAEGGKTWTSSGDGFAILQWSRISLDAEGASSALCGPCATRAFNGAASH